jgi:hypothetical protein
MHDSERQPYNVSAAIRLLREISLGLIARHAHFPNAKPQGNKAPYLRRERYFFQWHEMVIPPATINRLLRLVFAGMDLRDSTGRPFNITSHVLRHVGQTVARHKYRVPLEVIAALGLHHRLNDGHPSEAGEYYTLQPEQERLEQRDGGAQALDRRGKRTRGEWAVDLQGDGAGVQDDPAQPSRLHALLRARCVLPTSTEAHRASTN